MNTVIYTSLEKKLIDDWSALWNSSPEANYVNSPHWFLSVIESFNYDQYRVIALYEKGQLVAITGLIKEKRYGMTVYTIPPGDFVCGVPFLIDLQNKKTITVLVKELKKLGSVFLDNVPEPFVKLLQQESDIAVTPYSINFYLDFKKDETGKIIIPNRKKLLRKVKDLEDRFVLKPFYGKSQEAFTIAFQIDTQSRKQNRGYNAFSNTNIQDFYKSLGTHFKKIFCVNILYFEEKPILYEMGFRVGEIYFGSQIAFDEEYSSYAPGKVILIKLVESLSGKGVKKLNFGSGDSHVKRLFTSDYMQLYKVVISSNIVTRLYLTTIYQWKDDLFSWSKRHNKIYTLYRRIKRFLKI